jgi:dihydroorotate dehydrogenase
VSYALLRKALFRLDPEGAHEFAAAQMERMQAVPPLRDAVARLSAPRRPQLRRLWGIDFPNVLGIAAGFDKNAELISALCALGFGFVEVGTVTLQPQPGNPRPRLFRLPADEALINRMGFNNDGAERVAARLAAETRHALRDRIPVFVNVGKNRDVELADAAAAYEACYRVVGPWADGTVINVSSPNTPSLRDLQRPEHLEAILDRMLAARETMKFPTAGSHPILVKFSPDIEDEQLAAMAELCVRKADGIVATNTTIARSGLRSRTEEAGGLSGRPLFERSTAVLAQLRRLVGPRYPLVGVGGIFDARDARAKLDAGADLLQAYTAFIYRGPMFARRIIDGLGEEQS